MVVRAATNADDAGITALMAGVAMPGSMQIAFGCRPSFFQALRVEGNDPVVAVAEDQGEIVGAGAVTFRQVYFNGRVATVRYLSALRVTPRVRGSAALARGFARLRMDLAGRPADITLTSILSENTAALDLLTTNRAELPPYEPFCGCVTRVMAATRAETKPAGGFQIEQGAGAKEISGFLATHGPSRNLFPVCLPEDLDGRADSAFPGLTSGDFLVARDGGEILGVMACWDVMRFRQALVTGYTAWLRWARPWINIGARLSGRPELPKPGAALGLAFGTLTLVRNNDPRIFQAMLAHALAWTRRRGLGHFVLALADNDPLCQGFKRLPHREIRSNIFRVNFDDSSTRTLPDGRILHFEGAML
jgi:hypothetical protein